MSDVLKVNNVSVVRDQASILSDVSWHVNEGEHWVILGPNGAGKTTLVSLISGWSLPTTGTVEIIGETTTDTDLRELKSMVGVASAGIDARISGREKVLDVVRTAAYGRSATWTEDYDAEDSDRARGLLATLGVESLAERGFARISSGERKRVGIARALMPDPEILILDEPLAGLDFGGREQLIVTLEDLARAPYSPVMVMVTHHVEEIPQGFTHALLVKDGRVFAAGEIPSVITEANISELFGLPAQLSHANGRYFASVRR
ncbi:ABC transporter ATP-binding protein [Arcanobacterium pinnipediorum]|uniref:ABC transporter ATP-binding protein n=1 Tax=Arcanobacterium pinnipediorum TaxID=1503041 RepID=A0ABY5AFH0_9ACTO|nr:ABC transporter ATP-binding protein [Arcanobacterium pinnipediorum]USR78688.1 ABC transporter ATP-binding protein [Arcanobacterium pinnipediorum]